MNTGDSLTTAWRGWFFDLVTKGAMHHDSFSLLEPRPLYRYDASKPIKAALAIGIVAIVAFCVASKHIPVEDYVKALKNGRFKMDSHT